MTTKDKPIQINLDPKPKPRLKAIGGSSHDVWNERLSSRVAQAMPIVRNNIEEYTKAATAAMSVLADINPTDPIEGMLVAQMTVANEAALALYRRAWQNTPDYFEAATKYMALADKASRTVALLSERIDQHRTRGQQQIVVKHVTVNADQAVVTDQIVTGNTATTSSSTRSPALLPQSAETPMATIKDIEHREPAGGGKQ